MIFNIKNIANFCNITGVVHVGGFVGEELNSYRSIGLTNTIIFEPQPNLFEIIKKKIMLDEQVHNVALGSKNETKTMYVSHRSGGVSNGSGASSSLLKPKKHLEEHPEVTFPDEITVEVKTLDDYNITGFNFMNIDVQGYELEVLKGATNLLKNIDGLIVEVNKDEVYEGCPMIDDIDDFLLGFGIERVFQVWQSKSWGDALYIRKKND
jgi:FkbM family methyltransferase